MAIIVNGVKTIPTNGDFVNVNLAGVNKVMAQSGGGAGKLFGKNKVKK